MQETITNKHTEEIQSIRQMLIENPDHPNIVELLNKIEQLQGKNELRIEDLRLAINYTRNSFPVLDVWDCMDCHKEIASIYRYLDTGELVYKIPPNLDATVQIAIALAENENYKKQYKEEFH